MDNRFIRLAVRSSKGLMIWSVILALLGCAPAAPRIIGKTRAPLSPDQVGIYAQAPAHSDAVARLDSSGLGGFSSKREGTVTSVKLVKSSNISVADALAEERAIARWQFKPLKINGKSTAFRFIDHEYDSRDLPGVPSTCDHASGHLRFKKGKYKWAVFLMPHGSPIAVPIDQLKKS